MSEPSLAEVLRRLDETSRQLESIVGQMRSDRLEYATTYVRKDVYGAEFMALSRRVSDVEEYQASREKVAAETRRQLYLVVLASFLPSLGTLIVVLVRLSGSH